jgi:hypothetical protein
MGQVHTRVGDAQSSAHDAVWLNGGGAAPARNPAIPESRTPARCPDDPPRVTEIHPGHRQILVLAR